MNDSSKTKQEIIQENALLKRKIRKLETLEKKRKETEKTLRQSEERFRVVQEMSMDVFNFFSAVRDRDGRIIDLRWEYLNPTAARILGYERKDLIGRRVLDVLPDIEVNRDLFACYVRVMETGEPLEHEFYYEVENTRNWFRSMAIKVGDGLAVSLTDITQRKQAEETIKSREEQFRTLVNNMQDGVFRSDLKGYITFASPSAAQMIGCSSVEETIGINIGTGLYYHPAEMKKHMRMLREGGKLTRQQITFKRRDSGAPVIVSANIQFSRDSGGNVFGIEGVFRDITDRISAEEALRKSEAKYRLLHSSMRDAFVHFELDGTIREFNEAYLEMLGYRPEELKKFTYKDITPEKWHAFEAEVHEKQVFPRGYSDIYEKEYRRKDGTVFPIELRAFLLRDDAGNPAGKCAIIRDITERKQIEKDREKLIVELQQALKNVKTLKGLLPICSSCKKIRDDKGYWNRIESYITDRSDAEFSHGICPDCLQKLYPDDYFRRRMEKNS